MRSPLRCLVTPWGSAPRIRTSSRLILKGDFAATFRSSCELITINFTYGDQPNKGEDPIRGGQSSAFLLHAEGGAPAPPRHDFLQMLGVGKGPFKLLESIEIRFILQLRGSPPSRESNKGTQARLSSAISARATPELYSQQKPCGFHRNWPSPRSSDETGLAG